MSGRRAGFPSRLIADGIDTVVAIAMLFAIMVGFAVVRYLLGGGFRLPRTDALLTAWAFPTLFFLYLTTTWTANGRSVGKSMLGLRVMRNNGAPLERWRAAARALVCVTFGGISLLWAAISRRNEALHDIAFRTAVVYDWSD